MLATIFNQSGTYTSDQNVLGIDTLGARTLIWGVDVQAETGGSGVNVTVGFLAPDGQYYQIFLQTGITGAQWFAIDPATLPVVPQIINIGWGINGGGTSVTMTIWMLGQS
jgi:hypothetical protein